MLMICRRWLVLILLPLWLMWPLAATCGEPSPDSIQQMNHRTWTVANGAPADVWDMKQDDKGFIWLATSTGLFRWDGFQFERYVPAEGQTILSTDMTALRIVSDDDFWVGTTDGVIYHIKERHVASYLINDAGKEGPVYCFVVTPDGAMWVVAGRALLRYADGKLEKAGVDWGLPPGVQAMWMLVDKEGTAWLATDRELLFLRKGSHRFESTGISTGLYSVLALSPDGTLWVSDGMHGTRALPGLSARSIPRNLLAPLPTTNFGQSMRLAFDRTGALWGTFTFRSGVNGIFRVANPEQLADGQPLRQEQVTDRFSTKQGFTSIVTVPILVDRDGDVWVGTNFGLNRFHTNSFKVVSPRPGAEPAEAWMSQGANGEILLLQKGCLYRVVHAVTSKMTCDFPADSYSMFAGAGHFVSQTAEGLYQWSARDGGAPLKLPGDRASWDMTAIGKDADEHLWLGFSGALYEMEGNTWHAAATAGPLGHEQPTAIAFGPGGAMWLGYADGRVVSSHGKAPSVRFTSNRLNIGNIEAIEPQGRTIFFGGDSGVARWRAGRFQSITLAQLHVLSGVSGVAETAAGDLWLNTSTGIVLLEANEADHAFNDAGYTPNYLIYGSDDGVPGIASRQLITPTIAKDGDGRLWFQTNQGVCWIDPSTVRINRSALHTVIESVLAGGQKFPIDGHLVFPPNTTTVSFQYTAASFQAPQNVKFRYNLTGVDKDWRDGEAQRRAIYANLTPGDYEFQVEAADSDGVWGESPSKLAFRIERTFYQTLAFRIGTVALGVLCLIGLVAFQYRRMLTTLRDRIEVRHAERERIARELHDTLLQGMQGLIMFFQTVPKRIPTEDPYRERLNQALERAHLVVVEGRNRIRDLRASDHAMLDLVNAFTTSGQELAKDRPTRFRVISEGTPRDIDPAIGEEIYLIGREAILNAFQHAQASKIELCIAYEAKQFCIVVHDDGIGFDPEIIEGHHKPGHWGLIGMKERATSIGGRVIIRARSGAGTMVRLIVPSGVAYARRIHFRLTWIKRRLALRKRPLTSDR